MIADIGNIYVWFLNWYHILCLICNNIVLLWTHQDKRKINHLLRSTNQHLLYPIPNHSFRNSSNSKSRLPTILRKNRNWWFLPPPQETLYWPMSSNPTQERIISNHYLSGYYIKDLPTPFKEIFHANIYGNSMLWMAQLRWK